jgi:hypothetical protein
VRWKHGLCAAVLATAMGVAGNVQPAHAAETETRNTGVQAQAASFDWVGLVVSVAGALFGGGGSNDAALQAAVHEIVSAVESAKTDIINHADALAAAEVEGCVTAATIEFTAIEVFPDDLLIQWAQSVTQCATLATAYLGALQSREAVDNVGFLVGPIYAIVLAARAKAGLVNGADLVMAEEIRAYEAVVAKLVPQCSHTWEKDDNPRYVYQVYITCEVYPGKVGTDAVLKGWPPGRPEPPISYARATQRADALTSRSIALDALPQLRGVPRPVM